MRMSSIFKKTMMLTCVLFGLSAVLAIILSTWILNLHMTEEYLSKGKAIARSIANSGAEIMLNRDAATMQAMIDQYLSIEGTAYVYVEDGRGIIIAHTFVPGIPESIHHLPERLEEESVSEINLPELGRILDISTPILAGVAGHIHVGMDRSLINSYVWASFYKLQGLMLLLLSVSLVVFYYAVGKITQPLTELTTLAAKLREKDFSARVEIDSDSEIGILADTMRAMAKELSDLFGNMERKVSSATSELKDTSTYLRTIIDNLVAGLVVTDVYDRVALANPHLSHMFGLDSEKIVGNRVDQVFSADIVQLIQETKSSPEAQLALDLPMPGGRHFRAVATAVNQAGDEVGVGSVCLGTLVLVRDITMEREVDRMKTEFISTVSHELRTPMTSVIGFAKIIRRKLEKTIFPLLQADTDKVQKVAKQVRDNLDIIVGEGTRLTSLINDVLDIAKMESGKLEWRNQILDLEQLISQALASTQSLYRVKGLDVEVHVEKELPTIIGDHDRIIQVLVNLISNAVKFTEKGRIICTAIHHADRVKISVQDSGIGISAKDQEMIFERFKQVGDTLTDKPRGTGLGLPICRQIVEHHGGEIWVESEVGAGSTFHFTLALQPPAKTAAEQQPTAVIPAARLPLIREAGRPRVLVVDDDPALTRYLSSLLEENECEVLVATNGKEAVEQATMWLPNLITMDLMMPVMSGQEAIRILRRTPATKHIPIIVVTALADSEKTNGDVVLDKPLDEELFLHFLKALLYPVESKDTECLMLFEDVTLKFKEGMTVMCSGTVSSCAPEEMMRLVKAGFKGTIFIPAALKEQLDLPQFESLAGVRVVFLPEDPSGKEEFA